MALPITWTSGALPQVIGSGVSISPGGIGPDEGYIRINQPSGDAAHVRWDFAESESELAIATRVYIKTPTSWPSASYNVVAFNNAAHGAIAMAAFSGSGAPGQIRLLRTGGGTVIASPNNTVAVNTWYRVELQMDGYNTKARVAIFHLATEEPLWASPWQTHVNYEVPVRRVAIGAINVTPTVGEFGVDAILIADLPANDGWLGERPLEAVGLQARLLSLAGAVGNDIGTIRKNVHTRPLAAFSAALSRSWVSPCRIVWLGDSTVFGSLSSNPSLDFVTQVTKRLQNSYPSMIGGYEKPVVNVAVEWPVLDPRPGVQSYRSAAGGANSDTYLNDVNSTFVRWQSPHLVVHSVGINDILKVDPYKVSPEDYETNIRDAVDYIDTGVTHKVSHILIHNYRRSEESVSSWDRYRRALHNVARSRPNVLVVEVNEEFDILDHTGSDPFDLIATDGLHPSDNGHALIAELILKKMALPIPIDTSREHFLDTFTRANTANMLGQPAEKPVMMLWDRPGAGVPSLTDQTMRITTAGTVFIDCGLKDLEVDSMVTLPAAASAGLPGVVFRAADDNNRLGLFLNPVSSSIQLYRTMAGATAVVQSASLVLPAGNYTVQIRAEGSRIYGYVNGVKRIDYTMTAPEISALSGLTKIGFRNSSAAPDVMFHFLRASRI